MYEKRVYEKYLCVYVKNVCLCEKCVSLKMCVCARV